MTLSPAIVKAESDAKIFVAGILAATVCPQCAGPHTLSQCPNWRSPHILGRDRWDSASLEAKFHKLVRSSLSKRQQGYVMGAFREVFSQPQQPTEGTQP